MLILFVQLFLLGTIDPTGEDNPFQISKFYLATFIPVILLIGLSVDKLSKHFFEKEKTYPAILLLLILGLYLLSNFKTHDYSKNTFTRNLVLDGLSQLPQNSLVLTVDHPFYFGSLYEQKVNGKFMTIYTILHNGDRVEIETKKSAGPNKKWVEHCKTTMAKRHIKNVLGIKSR